MRVAFFRAYNPASPYQWSMPPLGIGYLMAVLKRRLPGNKYSFFMTIEEVIDAKPDLAAISSATENFTQAQSQARRVKEALGIPAIVGGMHITALPHMLPDCFDVGVLGEGEETIVSLIEACRDGGFAPSDLRGIPGVAYRDEDPGGVRHVVVNGERIFIKNLDELPYPDRDGLGQRWAVPLSREVHLISSRGCPYNCAFCSSGRDWTRFRRFSPEYVVGEIEYLRKRYDPEELFFFDDLFVAERAHFKRVCELLRERRLHEGVVFRSYARVNLIDNELMDLFEEFNFRYIDFGFESNCERTLRYYDKAGVTPEANQRAMDLIRGRNLSIGANIIVGAPDETLDDMRESYDFIARNRDSLDRLSMGPLLPLPGTRIWREAMERGLVSETMDDWSRLSYDPAKWDHERYPLLSKTMTVLELRDFIRHFQELEDAINDKGRLRKSELTAALREERVARLKQELDTVKGSRFVQWAMAARDLKRRLSGEK